MGESFVLVGTLLDGKNMGEFLKIYNFVYDTWV